MAETPTARKRVRPSRAKPRPSGHPAGAANYVSVDRFEKLEIGVNSLVEMLAEDRRERERIAALPSVSQVTPGNSSNAGPVPTPGPESPVEKEVRKAGPDITNTVPPEWAEKAQEIVGEAFDHCEMSFGKNGGVRFTVVIKSEMSNAPKDYLERMGQDRRTRDIGGEGIGGVEAWCKLIKQNLARPH